MVERASLARRGQKENDSRHRLWSGCDRGCHGKQQPKSRPLVTRTKEVSLRSEGKCQYKFYRIRASFIQFLYLLSTYYMVGINL